MIIEVEETFRTLQGLVIEPIAEKDHTEIIVIEIMNARIVRQIHVKGKFVLKYLKNILL